jgi:predicted nucleotidyltransferase
MRDYRCLGYVQRFAAEVLPKASETNDNNPHLRLTYDLLHQLARQMPPGCVGVTGGALLGFGLVGYSDIDLVLELRAYDKLDEALRNIPGVRLRTREEWMTFYSKYRVQADISASVFAEHMLRKRTQFLFHEVPVSVFVRSNLPDLSPVCSTQIVDVEGEVVDDARAPLLPARYTIATTEGRRNAIAYNRAFTEFVRNGERVRATGVGDGGGDIVIREGTRDRMERVA